MRLAGYLLYLLIQMEGLTISIPVELSLMIDARQILSTGAFYWFPTKTGHRVLKCPKSARYNMFLRRKCVERVKS